MLMADEYPRIYRYGVIALSTPASVSAFLSEGANCHAQAREEVGRSRGPSAGSRQGSPGGQGQAGRSGAPDPEAPLFVPHGLNREFNRRKGEVRESYPQARFRAAPGALWVMTRLQPVYRHPGKALLVLRYPGSPDEHPQAWAWWSEGVWIGPRHTNFPDASICSFERKERTWIREHPLDRLLDLHVLWVARHLHLHESGFWPGDQGNHLALERLTEQAPGELCGCGSMEFYGDCHQTEDAAWFRSFPLDRRPELLRRYPPPALVRYLFATRTSPPDRDELAHLAGQGPVIFPAP